MHGDINVLEDTVRIYQRAETGYSSDDTLSVEIETNLGVALLECFSYLGRKPDLDESSRLLKAAYQRSSEAPFIHSLSHSMLYRNKRGFCWNLASIKKKWKA
jgi:hypothetical protein